MQSKHDRHEREENCIDGVWCESMSDREYGEDCSEHQLGRYDIGGGRNRKERCPIRVEVIVGTSWEAQQPRSSEEKRVDGQELGVGIGLLTVNVREGEGADAQGPPFRLKPAR